MRVSHHLTFTRALAIRVSHHLTTTTQTLVMSGLSSFDPIRILVMRVSHHLTPPRSPENLKATKPAFSMGHYRPASEMPLQWRFAGRPLIAHFWWFLEHRSPQKKLIRVGPPLTKRFGSAHAHQVKHILLELIETVLLNIH